MLGYKLRFPAPGRNAFPPRSYEGSDNDQQFGRLAGHRARQRQLFPDFGYPDADLRQAKALLAAQIIKVLDAESLSTRQAEARTGIAHSEFVRIRNVNLARFTIDRLVTILGRLGQEVELSINIRPRLPRETGAGTAHL